MAKSDHHQASGHHHSAHRYAATKRQKTVKIKYHHTKPYRKRHYATLGFTLVAGIILLGFVVEYSFGTDTGAKNARGFVARLLNLRNDNAQQTVHSTYGYTVMYDPAKYYATALDAISGGLYFGEELATNRAYQTIRFSPGQLDTSTSQTSLMLTYRDDVVVSNPAQPDFTALQKLLVEQPRQKITKSLGLLHQTK